MRDLAWAEELFGPSEQSASVDWEGIRRRLGLEFPAAYRELLETYPALSIDEYLLIYHPEGPYDCDLLMWWEDAIQAQKRRGTPLRLLEFDPETGESLPTGRRYAFYPEPGGLFPWGMTETAYCFWLTDPDPERWTVVICGASWQWHYPGGVTDLLPDLLSARISCPLFADDWPDLVHGIEVMQFPHA